ncbi:MAG: FprA family A-type flavoprotein [Oscillospiraceae bacterium]|nr:FprA family A-type flavoprotein [Oscillospiraceae bacterium]
MIKLKEGLYHVGARDPGLKVFDVIVPTDRGTTYNAYLIRGEKTCLIETVHDKCSDELIANIREICPVEEIDYIVCDHTEPDHSGSLGKILDLAPDAVVYASAPAIKNIKNILNRDISSVVAKNGSVLDLGGYTLKFLSAPNLHWPDSIFTWCEELQTAFTCDFLGSPYCGEAIDDEITDERAYLEEMERYYTYIFGPFPQAVRKGAEILRGLSPDMVCTSHGPVLHKMVMAVNDMYDRWAQDSIGALDPKKIAIFYVSAYGYTKAMAEALAKGAESAGAHIKIYEITGTDGDTLAEAVRTSAGYMFGSPTLNRDALPPVYSVLGMVSAVTDRGKPALMFGSYGWSGEACGNMADRAKGLGLKADEELMKVCFAPSDEDRTALTEKGRSFAESVIALS